MLMSSPLWLFCFAAGGSEVFEDVRGCDCVFQHLRSSRWGAVQCDVSVRCVCLRATDVVTH